MPDLATNYLGLRLSSPLVASASPLSKRVETAQRLEEAGVAAIVMYSLFEEQIIRESRVLDYYLAHGTETFAEALSYLPDMGSYSLEPDRYLEQVRRLKSVLSIPVIGSLNGVSAGGWTDYAALIEQAGADALELNIYYLPTDLDLDAVELEAAYVALVRQVCAKVQIPVAVKLSPFFSALPNMAQRLYEAGASALVLFNRFYQPDIDLEALEFTPNLQLSSPAELRLALRWIGLLSGRVRADFAASGGVHTAEDLLKAVLVGARATMVASALLQHGPAHAAAVLAGVRTWMEQHEYESIRQMCGSMRQEAVGSPAALERANYMKVLGSFDYDPRFAPLQAQLQPRPASTNGASRKLRHEPRH
ncbi:MAG: dihydroorotate dehydrogenase-like protein [Roseiflexaceae bacterium]